MDLHQPVNIQFPLTQVSNQIKAADQAWIDTFYILYTTTIYTVVSHFDVSFQLELLLIHWPREASMWNFNLYDCEFNSRINELNKTEFDRERQGGNLCLIPSPLVIIQL